MTGTQCATKMDIETSLVSIEPPKPPPLLPQPLLKRSTSLPLVNSEQESEETLAAICQPSPTRGQGDRATTLASRTRRYSASTALGGFNANNNGTPERKSSTPVKIPSRINQIKQEESLNVSYLEAKHEREVQSAFQIRSSCEELNLGDRVKSMSKEDKARVLEPVSIFPYPYPLSSTPSPTTPTRGGKQCFSPSMQVQFRTNSLTPSPTPSPTRKSVTKQSMSPILRPSSLSLKRKLEDMEYEPSPPKRLVSPDQYPLVTVHPLIQSTPSPSSMSSSGGSTPPQRVPSGPVADLIVTSQAQSNHFAFTPVSSGSGSSSSSSSSCGTTAL